MLNFESMKIKMNWSSLFTAERIDNTSSATSSSNIRHSFQKDFDRIIFSTAFRRLQDKTQVFPLPGPTFVHNRLTHSLEVASVGRSLAEWIGNNLCDKYNFNGEVENFYRYQFPWVIASACLAHDLGNPPFGHSGEDAIRHFFSQPPEKIEKWLSENLTIYERNDLEKFEGNSMAFRFLTQKDSIFHSDLNLTKTTICSIIKYPCSSINGFQKNKYFVQKKANYFSSEKEIFLNLMIEFGIPKVDELDDVYVRHPFVYLTEAADDICYRIIDLEDAHRLKIISTEDFIKMVMPFFTDNEGVFSTNYIESKLSAFRFDEEKISFLRALWIGKMVQDTADIFIQNEAKLLNGNFDKALLDAFGENEKTLLKVIEDFSVKNVYKYEDSIGIELGGYRVLYQILDELLSAVIFPDSSKSKLILHFLRWDVSTLKDRSSFEKVMHVLDFVTACTDSYALDLYKKLTAGF